ncbi:MAG: response regulator transcription factor [Planctomycetes bacterium]|nr:response regulator transcription factor [Planctomycetota bacterium]
MRILVVEDDAAIRQGVVDLLESEGYETHEAADGDDGLEAAVLGAFDLVLLDLILPGKSGFAVLEGVRAARPTLPVICLTARGEEDDRVRGLKLGADDYIVKPFSARELLARVEAVLRRSAERPADVARVEVAGAIVDLNRCEVLLPDGGRVDLSERERELLRYLVQNAGRAISRDELLSNVWRVDPRGVETRTIDMHVARLREKLRDDKAAPRVIVTVRGKGYMFARPGSKRGKGG